MDTSLKAEVNLASTARIGKRTYIYPHSPLGRHETHFTGGLSDLVTLSLPHA